MEKAQDVRSVRTYQALQEAFFSLLEKYSVEEITVIQLCEEAKIKRATFYKHFKDINSFVDFYLTYMFNELFPPISQNVSLPKRDEYLVCLFKKIFDFVEVNRDILKLSLDKINTTTLYALFYSAMFNEMTRKVAELIKKGYIFKVPAEIIGEYYAGALIALVKWWLLSGTEVTKEEFADYFYLLIEKEYFVNPFI